MSDGGHKGGEAGERRGSESPGYGECIDARDRSSRRLLDGGIVEKNRRKKKIVRRITDNRRWPVTGDLKFLPSSFGRSAERNFDAPGDISERADREFQIPASSRTAPEREEKPRATKFNEPDARFRNVLRERERARDATVRYLR